MHTNTHTHSYILSLSLSLTHSLTHCGSVLPSTPERDAQLSWDLTHQSLPHVQDRWHHHWCPQLWHGGEEHTQGSPLLQLANSTELYVHVYYFRPIYSNCSQLHCHLSHTYEWSHLAHDHELVPLNLSMINYLFCCFRRSGVTHWLLVTWSGTLLEVRTCIFLWLFPLPLIRYSLHTKKKKKKFE